MDRNGEAKPGTANTAQHSVTYSLPERVQTSTSLWSTQAHKKRLSVRLILSATETCNYVLAKWLVDKLKPLSVNNHTIFDVFQFAKEIHELGLN